MRKWSGSYGIMLTPFDEYGRVDFDEVERQVDILCSTQVAGIVVCGSTGEFLFVSEQDNKQIMTVAKHAAAGRKQMVAGAIAPGRDIALSYLRHMAKLGYDGALVAPPYYYIYPDEDTAKFYAEITAEDTGVGIIAYQIPAFTNSIGERTFTRLLELPQVEGLKNSSKNIQAIAQQVAVSQQIRPDFTLLTGTEDAFLACLTAGCDGGFTAFGALMPDSMAKVYTLFLQGEVDTAFQIQNRMLPMQALCASLPFPLGYKLLGEVLGMKNGYYHQSIGKNTRVRMAEVKHQLQKILAQNEPSTNI